MLWLLIFSVVVFVQCLTVITSTPHNLVQLREAGLMKYLESKSFPMVDMILMPPFVMGHGQSPTNYSALSVMRFAPWIRRLHIHDPDHEPSKNMFEYWKSHQKSRIIHFSASLRDYVLTSPFLTEQFIILEPYYTLTNYVFNWQFFIGSSPVIRSCSGISAMTRQIMNECYADPVEHGVRKGLILYEDNMDHFVPPCSGTTPRSITYMATMPEQEIRDHYQFEEIHKKRDDDPFKINLCVATGPRDDQLYPVPDPLSVTVWVVIVNDLTDSERLSFVSRQLVSHNLFIEVRSQFQAHDAEKMGVTVMRKLREFSNGKKFKVAEIFCHKGDEVATRLAKTYESVLTPFVSREPTDRREWVRLEQL